MIGRFQKSRGSILSNADIFNEYHARQPTPENTMNLYDSISRTLARLNSRLEKKGIKNVAGMGYDRYLSTQLWKQIKEWIFERDNNTCQICKTKQLDQGQDFDVHHRSYSLETLEGRNEAMLVTLCRRCHCSIEYCDDGSKRKSMAEKEERYRCLLKIHAEIEADGMDLKMEIEERGSKTIIRLTYVGKDDYKVFYNVTTILFVFAINFHWDYKLAIPMPFKKSRLFQKSGAWLKDKTSNNTVATLHMNNDIGEIKYNSECELLVQQYLRKIIINPHPKSLRIGKYYDH